MHRNPVIVHISDLHFGWSNHNTDAAKELSRAICTTFPLPDFVLVTGDLTQWGWRKSTRRVRKYLQDLLETIWQTNKHPTRCIVVPGNHDLMVLRRRRLKAWNKIFESWGFAASGVPEDAATQPASLTEFYRTEQVEALPQAAHNATIQGRPEDRALEALRVCEYFPQFRLAIIKINSNARKNWRLQIAKGYAGREQLARIETVLHDYERAFADFKSAQRLAMVHHHVTYLPNVRYDGRMLMSDAGDVWQRLAELRFTLILHGHRHRASRAGLTYWNAGGSELGTNVLAAGSASAEDTDDGSNSYHRIHMRDYRSDVLLSRFEAGHFSGPENSARFSFFRRIEPLQNDLDAPLNMEALIASLLTDEEFPDENHQYDLVQFTGIIDNSRNYHGIYVLKGHNVIGRPTESIPFSLTAVGSHNLQDILLTASDRLGSTRIRPEPIGPRRTNVLLLRIPFTHPLAPGEPFEIEIRFRLLQVMFDQDDYDMLNLVCFARGVKRIEHRLFADRKISEPAYLAVEGNRIVRTTITPKPVRASIDLTASGGPGPADREGYAIEIDQPQAISYLFYYHRLLPR